MLVETPVACCQVHAERVGEREENRSSVTVWQCDSAWWTFVDYLAVGRCLYHNCAPRILVRTHLAKGTHSLARFTTHLRPSSERTSRMFVCFLF